jgi:recombination protein RecA
MAKRAPAKKKQKKAEVVRATPTKPTLTPEQIEARKLANATIAKLEKDHGKGIVMRLGTSPLKREVPVVRTGSIGLDEALGVGGMPYGRVAEIYGPESSGKTTLALHIIANAQRQGHICAFIDAEHALDIEYASDLGVDIQELLLSQPDCGEQALEVADHLVNSMAVKIVVIDSVAALTPRAEIEGEMGDHHVGLQARLMSQALRKLTAAVSRNGAIVIFINQIRMKIGVRFGCFHEDTPVIFAGGAQHKIRDVVEQKMEGPVLSFENGKVVPKKIKDWYENGSLSDGEEWITITTSSSGGPSGNMSFTCTPNHIVFKQYKGKWHPTRAGEIREGDLLESWMEQRIAYNRIYRDIIFGSLLGDGALRKRSEATACLSLANQEQPEYLAWKLEKLEELGWAPAGNEDRPRWNSQYTAELCVLRDQFYPYGTGFRGIPKHIELTPLMAAVWYMDDGYYKQSHKSGQLSLKRLWPHRRSEVVLARGMLADFIGCAFDKITISDAWKGLSIHTSAFAEFSKKIKKYVPEFMQYKLNPEDRKAYEDFDPGSLEVSYRVPLPVKVLVASTASKRKHKAKRKYDLEVEGNYLVGGSYRGVRVHNSPETTTGGNALKFYSSVRLDIRRIGAIKKGSEDGAQFLGNRTRVKVVKNKVAPPFRQAEFDIIYGKGISMAGEILDIGVTEGVVEKSGAWYAFGSERIGQGRENAKNFLEENPELIEQIRKQLEG